MVSNQDWLQLSLQVMHRYLSRALLQNLWNWVVQSTIAWQHNSYQDLKQTKGVSWDMNGFMKLVAGSFNRCTKWRVHMYLEERTNKLTQIIPYSEQHLQKKIYFGRWEVRTLAPFLLFVNISLWMLWETAICARGTRLWITVLQPFPSYVLLNFVMLFRDKMSPRKARTLF